MADTLDMTDLEIARECGATSYSPPPLRAVRGLSFTFDQLTAFADRIRDQQREVDAAIAEHLNGWGSRPAPELAEHIASAIRSPAADAPAGEVKP